MTERLLVLATGLVVVVGSLSAAASGELAGFVYPGDFLVWTVALGVGGIVVLRARPGHSIGRLFLWAALASSLTFLSFQGSLTFFPEYMLDQETGSYPAGTPMWFRIVDSVLGAGYAIANVLVVAAFARFPDGRWVSRGVKWLFWFSIPLILLGNLGILPLAGAVPVIAIAIVIVRRSFRAGAAYRRQVAWVLIGYGLYLLIGISSVVLPEGVPPDWLTVSSIILFPIGMVLAITRYKLYELDRIVSRTVSYGIVIGAMVLVYLGVVLTLGALLDLGGDTEVALATLAAVAVSVPLLRRVRRWVDRRFFRSRYDAARVVARVADDLRTTVDLDEVERRTEAVIDEVFAPEDVTVWLAEERA